MWLLGGRAAEEIVFETVTTGAANDIEKATGIAKAMVTEYGMSKRFGLIGLASMQNKYLDSAATLNCSDATEAEIDAEVVAILKESYEKAKELLRENRELMDKLAEYLIEKETITGKEFMEIFRREKGLPDPGEETAEGGKSAAGSPAGGQNGETPENRQTAAQNGESSGSNPADGQNKENSGNNPGDGRRENQTSGMDVTVTDGTAHSQDGQRTGQEPDAAPQKDTVVPGTQDRESRPPHRGSTGRFSGGNL